MKRIDPNYVAQLLLRAQQGDSNAFAELYTATYEGQFSYAYEYLGDYAKAKQALKDTYSKALMELSKLQQPELFPAWLYQLNFATCYAMEHDKEDLLIQGKKYHLNQLRKNLPMTEAQVLIMCFYQEYKDKQICNLLGLRKSEVRAYKRSGCKHLSSLLQEKTVA